MATSTTGGSDTIAGKFLGFRLGDEHYGVAVSVVREIIEMQPITKLPRTPHYVLGMLNLRGKIIPVVDLRRKLGLCDGAPAETTRIVVIDAGGQRTGVVVDGVSDVLDIAQDQIEAPPHLQKSSSVTYLQGIAKLAARVYILMDVAGVLSADDASQLNQLVGAADGSDQE